MKKCPVCGKEYTEGIMCEDCGIMLVDEESSSSGEQQNRPKQQTQFGAPSEHKKTTSGGGITIPIPVLAACAVAVAVIILIIVVLKFTVFKEDDPSDLSYYQTYQSQDQPTYDSYDTNSSSMPSEETEDINLDEVDIDAIHLGINTIEGKLTNDGPNLMVELSEPKNVYAYDPNDGEERMLRNVEQIYINEDDSIELDDYFGQQVTADGVIRISGEVVMMAVADVSGSDGNAAVGQFGVYPETVEDYAANLDPAGYEYYESGIDDFYFAYPAGLYNSAELDESAYQTVAGENVQTITFGGSEGSELIFSLSRRTDGGSVEERTDRIRTDAESGIVDLEEIVNSCRDGYGKLVLTGWTGSAYDETIYYLVKVYDDYVMSMKILTPAYESRQDELYKGYVTECLYRMCGFSDSDDTWRSYSEYAEAAG